MDGREFGRCTDEYNSDRPDVLFEFFIILMSIYKVPMNSIYLNMCLSESSNMSS